MIIDGISFMIYELWRKLTAEGKMNKNNDLNNKFYLKRLPDTVQLNPCDRNFKR